MKIKLYYEGNLQDPSGWKRKEYAYSKKILEAAHFDIANEDQDYDLLHVNTIGHKSKKILNNARKQHKPILFQIHDDIYSYARWGILSGFIYGMIVYRQQRFAKKCDMVIVNKMTSKLYMEEKQVEPLLIKRGLRPSNFAIPNVNILAFRRYFQISKKDKVIVGVGNVNWQKGYYDFIKVASKFPYYKFIWFGKNPSFLDFENRRYRKNLPPNVILSDFVNHECYLGALGSADIFFSPSYEEDVSNTLLKAMAGERTIIVRSANLSSEFLHGEHYYKGSSIEDFCWLVENILNHKLPSTGKNAKEAVERIYSFETTVARFLKIYHELITKKSQSN